MLALKLQGHSNSELSAARPQCFASSLQPGQAMRRSLSLSLSGVDDATEQAASDDGRATLYTLRASRTALTASVPSGSLCRRRLASQRRHFCVTIAVFERSSQSSNEAPRDFRDSPRRDTLSKGLLARPCRGRPESQNCTKSCFP